jgi:hypothetical protein
MYDPTTWVDDSAPDIDAFHLNKMEQGIKDAHTSADANTAAVSALGGRVSTLEAGGAVSYRRFTKDAIALGARGDNATDNTTVLQGALDAIRDQGYGELYLPGAPGTVYRSKGLWATSGCRVVSDPGVILKITAPSGVAGQAADGHWSIPVSGDLRTTSWDGDLVPSDGLFVCTQTRLGYTGLCHDVKIENLTIDSGTIVCWAVQGLKLINVGRINGFFGYAFNGFKNGQQGFGEIPGNGGYCGDVLVDGGFVKNVGRNGYELSSVRRITIKGALIDGILGNDGGSQDPGAGIENELENVDAWGFDINLDGNTIRNCAGAGIAFIRSGAPENANLCRARGNSIQNVSTTPYGGANSPTNVGTQGAVWFNGEGASGEEVIIVEGNQVRGVVRGGMIAAGDFNGQVVATGNVCKAGSTGATGTFRQANFVANNVGL